MQARTRLSGGLTAVALALSCCAPQARAGWSADPVTITSTSASIPLVEGCSDGAHGAFVAWQEGDVLRAQHVLPTGDLDPAWPAAGAIACGVPASRTELVAVPDRLGGFYLLWEEGATLYATRLDPTGAVAAGWAARGRALGSIHFSPRPSVIEDGANGFYAAWASGGSVSAAVAIHLGPGNTGAGGWPNGTRTISASDPQQQVAIWPQLALAPDGGAFMAWVTFGYDASGWVPGFWKLQRISAAGLAAPGWPGDGVSFGEFHYEYIDDPQRLKASLLALAEDGRGGVFLMIGNPTGRTYSPTLETRLYRLLGDGQSASGWPAGGVIVPNAPETYEGYWGPDGSHRLLFDHRDGVLVGTLALASDYGTSLSFQRCSSDIRCVGATFALPPIGYEIASRGDGGFFVADFHCCGPYNPYDLNAFIHVTQYPKSGPDFGEWHPEAAVGWYGDIGLAPTEDGGAVFFWSQVRDRIGLFARRFNSAGEVTAVELGPSHAPGLSRLRFVPGEGVRATISLAGPRAARFELFDVAGRRIASRAVEAGELTLAGTATLPSGLYFGRLVAGADAISRKLIIAR